MSGLHNSSNNRASSNLPYNSGRSFATSFSVQSGAPSPVFHPTTGSMQGLHNFHGNFNVANMPGILGSRSSTTNNVPASGVQQPSRNLSSGQFASINIPFPPQIAHGSSHGHSGVTNRGGMSVVGSPGFNSSASGMGVSHISGNAGHRITASVGNMAGMFEQASPAVSSMLGNSYYRPGQLSQNHVQPVNNLSSMRFSNDVNTNDGVPSDLNEFPQLNSHPSYAGGPQEQGSQIKQENQEFCIRDEDFPALPGSKGRNSDYVMGSHQKVHDNVVPMMQPQPISVGRSAGSNLSGSSSSQRPPQLQQQHPPSVSGSGLPISSNASFHPQTSGPPPGLGSRPLHSSNTVSGIGSSDQQYQQQQQNPSQLPHDPFGMLGLLDVVNEHKTNESSLALGTDLSALGLNLNSTENLHTTFASPWSNEPLERESEFTLPSSYNTRQSPALSERNFTKFKLDTLFYIFYSMPKDVAQLYAAIELHNRDWLYHREQQLWFTRSGNQMPLVQTNTSEKGTYTFFNPNTWETYKKENFVLQYEMLEERPKPPQPH